MYDILYNGMTGRENGLVVAERPDIPAPARRAQSYDIAGRDGALVELDGTYGDIGIEVTMNFISPRDDWMLRFARAKRWLYGDGDRRLVLSDNTGYFYKVKDVAVGAAERTNWRVGQFTVTFTVDPYMYLFTGTLAREREDVRFNPYDISHPVYQIAGEGACTLTVNGNAMGANVGQNLTVDTDRMIAYREDGGLMNTSVTGDYEGLYLLPGDNTIEISEDFTLKVIPNWRVL